MTKVHLLVLLGGVAVLLATNRLPAAPDDESDRARRIHANALVVDTHVDIPNLLKPGWVFTEEHKEDHVDLPRMKRGGLDAVFFSIYMPGTVTGATAVNDALLRIAAVRTLVANLPDQLALCTTAEEIRRANREKKIAVLMGMEGGHMLNDSLALLRVYADLGVRYLTLTHNVDTDWADSVGDKPAHGGLTTEGREVVVELNRLGVMVDISHSADTTFWDALEVSRAPMIASHSSSRSIARHPRNMTDDMMRALAAKGGVVEINYHVAFLDDAAAQWTLATADRTRELEREFPGPAGTDSVQTALAREFGPRPDVRWEKIVDHIDHAVQVAGVDHVGLGSDFDGATMPLGMDDVSYLPRITEELVRRHYRESDIRKILGENTLRLMRDVERVGAELRRQPRGK